MIAHQCLINWQQSKQGIRWLVSLDRIVGSGVHPSRSSIFWSYRRLKIILFWNSYEICCGYVTMAPTIKILISNWPRTRESRQLFQNTGGEALFLPWARVGHALMQHLETCLHWQIKLTEFVVNLCLFQLDVQNEIQQLSRVFCYSRLICLLGFWLRNASLVKVGNSIWDGIFSFFTFLDA